MSAISKIIFQKSALANRYDGENDIIPNAPVVTYTDMQLLDMVGQLLNLVVDLTEQVNDLKDKVNRIES